MKNSKLNFSVLIILMGITTLTFAACSDDDDTTVADQKPASVVEVITGSENHTTLAAAVAAAGLVPTLQGAGPFTVFAPTDAAFAALPAGTVETLLEDPAGDLTDILLYHVLGSEVMSASLSDGMTAPTVFGADVTVMINSQGVFINNAQVVIADIETGNGVVHVIDAVLIP